jgi:hypothetical protein
MKDFLLIAVLIVAYFAVDVAADKVIESSRKSKPPVKITDPNDIKNRKDICYGRSNYTEPHSTCDGEVIS